MRGSEPVRRFHAQFSPAIAYSWWRTKVIRKLNTEVLPQSGYSVDAAENGAVAWETIQRQGYDLVLTDYDMPKAAGIDLVRKLRAARMALPVIMCTGTLPMEEFHLQARSNSAAMLIKPYTIDELRMRNKFCCRLLVPVGGPRRRVPGIIVSPAWPAGIVTLTTLKGSVDASVHGGTRKSRSKDIQRGVKTPLHSEVFPLNLSS